MSENSLLIVPQWNDCEILHTSEKRDLKNGNNYNNDNNSNNDDDKINYLIKINKKTSALTP